MKKTHAKKIESLKTIVVNYPVGDFLIRLKNARLANRKSVMVRKTKIIKSVAEALKREGFVRDIEDADDILTVHLAIAAKEIILLDIKLVSRPGLRTYKSIDEIESYRGPETMIISTSKGVMSDSEAKKMRVGGEVIALIL